MSRKFLIFGIWILLLACFVSSYSECSTIDCVTMQLNAGNSVKLISNISFTSYGYPQITHSDVELDCDNYYIKGKRIYDSGFNFTSVSGVTVKNCNLFDSATLWFSDSNNNIIINNYVKGMFGGINLVNSNNNLIQNNIFSAQYYSYANGENNIFDSNQFMDYGTEYDRSIFISGKGGRFTNNYIEGVYYGVYLDASDFYISNMTSNYTSGFGISGYTDGLQNNTYIINSPLGFSANFVENITVINSYFNADGAKDVYIYGGSGGISGGENIYIENAEGAGAYGLWIDNPDFSGYWINNKNVTFKNIKQEIGAFNVEDLSITHSSGRASIGNIKNGIIENNNFAIDYFGLDGDLSGYFDNVIFEDNTFNGTVDLKSGKDSKIISNHFISGGSYAFYNFNDSEIGSNTFDNSDIYFSGNNLDISENEFKGMGGLSIGGTSDNVNFFDNTLTNSSLIISGKNGFVSTNAFVNSSLFIRGDNNQIENNYLSGKSYFPINNDEPSDNVFIRLYNTKNVLVKNNILIYGEGITLSDSRPYDYGNNEIYGNRIENCTYGLRLYNYNYTDNIHDNIILGAKEYAVYNYGNQDIHLENNQWGTDDENVIQTLIYDIFDDATRGRVYYSPWLPWGQQAVDADNDGVDDAIDNCLGLGNPGQEDSDNDKKGNACDTCPLDKDDDYDKDGICGNLDNCPNNKNPNQQDADGDGNGDACDSYNNENPLAIASADLIKGKAPFTVKFTGMVVGGNSPVAYNWNFKDGSSSTQKDITHTFQTQGTYEVEFTTTDKDGDLSTSKKTITVTSDEITISEYSPSSLSLTLNEGEQQIFNVKAQKNPAWYLDGLYKGKSESYTLSTNSRSAGVHTLRAVVDNSKAVEWTVTVNDINSGKDFQILNLKLDKLQTSSGNTVISFNIYNNGNTQEEIKWSVNTGTSTLSNKVTVAGNSYTTIFAYWNYKAPGYTVTATVDPDSLVSEDDETNNVGVLNI